MALYEQILGCLLGTAIGDAVGLRREGLSRARAVRLYGSTLMPNLIFGLGYCSDDTEHSLMIARALSLCGGDVGQFETIFAAELKRWILTVPAGTGFATLRACLKLLAGFGPTRSGIFSAGNGPAMRSAIIGIYAKDEDQLTKLVRASTRLTHTDPKAEEGARLVARAARLRITIAKQEPIDFLRAAASSVVGGELQDSLGAAAQALEAGKSCEEFADSRGWTRGVSGYVNQTVPAALYCWAYSPSDFQQSVEHAVLLGGDTDSVAAITGAISGANLGYRAIPSAWVERLAEWPRTVKWIEELSRALADAVERGVCTKAPPMHWLATIPRNLVFAIVVIGLGIRRLLPPY
jgi:ADP-ribosyl-[dinitrogen reductase] hydrolase